MRFDTLGGQYFLAHPLICGGYGGGEIFSTPESDDVPPQKSGQKLRVGGTGIQIFPGELHAFEANIYREKKSFC